MKCGNCKAEIVKLKEDDFGEEIDWNTRWEQYLCDVCHDAIWKSLFDNACPQCRTEPCKRGRDCWVNPFPRIMYLCYVAPRVKLCDTALMPSNLTHKELWGESAAEGYK